MKVFSATMFEQGETVSNRITANANIQLTDHCVAITVFYWQPTRAQ